MALCQPTGKQIQLILEKFVELINWYKLFCHNVLFLFFLTLITITVLLSNVFCIIQHVHIQDIFIASIYFSHQPLASQTPHFERTQCFESHWPKKKTIFWCNILYQIWSYVNDRETESHYITLVPIIILIADRGVVVASMFIMLSISFVCWHINCCQDVTWVICFRTVKT